jgi:hypothetical protein
MQRLGSRRVASIPRPPYRGDAEPRPGTQNTRSRYRRPLLAAGYHRRKDRRRDLWGVTRSPGRPDDVGLEPRRHDTPSSRTGYRDDAYDRTDDSQKSNLLSPRMVGPRVLRP